MFIGYMAKIHIILMQNVFKIMQNNLVNLCLASTLRSSKFLKYREPFLHFYKRQICKKTIYYMISLKQSFNTLKKIAEDILIYKIN